MSVYKQVQEIAISTLLDIAKPGVNLSVDDAIKVFRRISSSHTSSKVKYQYADTWERSASADAIGSILVNAGYESISAASSPYEYLFLGIFQSQRERQELGQYTDANVSIIGIEQSGSSKVLNLFECMCSFNFPLRLGDPIPTFLNPVKTFQNLSIFESEAFIQALQVEIGAKAVREQFTKGD